jgi:hypothetical protein
MLTFHKHDADSEMLMGVAGMTALPTWLVFIGFIAGLCLSTAAALTAFLQWKTAHEKALLDLFDRRYGMYEDLVDGIRQAKMDRGVYLNHKAFKQRSRYKMIFGNEVYDLVDLIYKEIVHLDASISRQKENFTDEREDRINAMQDKLTYYLMNIDDFFAPYIQLKYRRVNVIEEMNLFRLRFLNKYRSWRKVDNSD